MPFNINEFKSRMDRFGGPAKTSLFTVELYGTPSNPYMSDEELRFFCKNVTLPGIDFETVAYRRYAIDIPQAMPTAINAEPLSCIFMLDSRHRVMSFFHQWAQRVVNYGTASGLYSAIDDQLPYEVGYKDEYSCRMVIKYYTNDGLAYEATLDGVFPVTVQSIDLAWENNDDIALLPVAFSYDRIQYSSEIYGESSNRANGLLDLLVSLGDVGQSLTGSVIPTSIQDAIDLFTDIEDIFT